MSKQTIAVFGEALVDDFITEQVVGGAPFNVARNLAAFGVATLMVTRIGADKNGASICDEFARFRMSESALQVDEHQATGRVVVERNDGGHRFIILPDQAYDYVQTSPALAALAITQPAVIYYGTMAQRHVQSRATLRAMLEASDAQRYLDLNVREGQVTERIAHESLKLADVVKVNEDELQDLFKWYTHAQPSDMEEACLTLMRSFELKQLIVTLGERGALHFSADGTVTANHECHAPARIVDTVGAGDAFSAVFLFGQSQGWPLPLTMARANAFAGAICGISGAVPADIGFYAPWLDSWQRGAVHPGAAS
ncbi:fructokinase [Duganella sp. FT80W]|uniref:Fructokinase n=1 Tax=Duganella guangzhouensis TaxID=2666084 RepID=A0A6I2L874_9BURK|nr:PfkB family carbohydrate kinase [Duganella guangzhouensis]MRW93407.1 fructokinase [Duganella guangzhouensis]